MLIETDRYRVRPGVPVDLTAIDTRGTAGFDGDKDEAKKVHKGMQRRLAELQEQFYADGRHRLLLVLQATDTGGKDSTIRKVFTGVNPAGVDVTGFKKPSAEELAHDYLWRVHDHAPAAGRIAVFNRSHYEDVLVVRVHSLVPEERWSKRYEHINDFEQMLADEGTTIRKVFLHISRTEQKERLQARLDDPTKHWKFNVADLAERSRWPDYQAAYTAMLERTSTDHAPWYVVPADRKWYRNLVVSSIVIETLEGLGLEYPQPDDLDGVVIPD